MSHNCGLHERNPFLIFVVVRTTCYLKGDDFYVVKDSLVGFVISSSVE